MSRMLSIRVPDELHARIEEAAAESRLTRDDLVVELLQHSLKRREIDLSLMVGQVIADREELFARLANGPN